MSSQVLGNRALAHFDALIIGSGPSGSAVAALLTAHGKDVLVLEGGSSYFEGLDDPAPEMPTPLLSSDEIKMSRRGLLGPDPLVDPQTWRRSEADGARIYVGPVNTPPKTVGGGSVHADMKLPRFRPQDFRLGSLLPEISGASFADWPVDYDALEPFYRFAEQRIGVQGQAGADPNEPPRSAPFPMPPGPISYDGQLITRGAARLGYTAFPFPCGVNSRPYDGRPACVECGFCGGFGCPIKAKGSAPVTSLRRALLSGHCQLHTETRVTRLLMSASGTEVIGAEGLDGDGQRSTFQADRYVLCANAIEDARLLLLSDPGGVGNSSGLLGRNLTFHSHMVAIGVFDERIHGYRGRGSPVAISDFRGVAGDVQRPLSGIVEVGGTGGPIQEAMYYRHQLNIGPGAQLKALLRQGFGRDRAIIMSLFGEDAPQGTNRVDLDPDIRDYDRLPVARVTYRAHAFEQSAQAFYAPKLLDILGASGARYAAIAPVEDLPATDHQMGTLRFGTDPKRSVCDESGRFHDVGNLLAADGSLFPTSSGFNPTLTVVALAYRVAAGMLFPGSPERALTK